MVGISGGALANRAIPGGSGAGSFGIPTFQQYVPYVPQASYASHNRGYGQSNWL